VAQPKDELLDHNYDGIQEFDNDLPGWWKNLFYITIVIALVYWVHYHVLDTGTLPAEEYRQAVDPTYVLRSGPLVPYHSPLFDYEGELTPRMEAELERLANQSFETHIIQAMGLADSDQLARLQSSFPDIYTLFLEGGLPAPRTGAARPGAATVPEDLEVLTGSADLAAGSDIFKAQCSTCHGDRGQGGIGPNMADDYWLHGGQITDVVRTITVGVPAKGMIPWRGTLSADQIHQAASFILLELQGTAPPNAKAPEGEKAP